MKTILQDIEVTPILEYVINKKIKSTVNINKIDDISNTPYIYNKVKIYTGPNDIKAWKQLSDKEKINIITLTQKALDIINKKEMVLGELYYYRGNYPTFIVRQNKTDKTPKGWLLCYDGKTGSDLKINTECIVFNDYDTDENYIIVDINGKSYTPNIADIIKKN